MTELAQAHEATSPARPETQRLGIERRRFITLPHPDRLGHGHTVYPQYAAEKITEVRGPPAPVLPRDGVVLIAPMSLLTAVESRKGGDQHRLGRDAGEGDGLFGIEIKDPIPVHGMRGIRILIRT